MPNYGILQPIPQAQNPGLIENFLTGLQAAKQSQLQAQQGELAKLQMVNQQKALEFLPQQQAMELEKHKQSLAANNLSMQVARQGMGTESIKQQQLKNDMELKNLEFGSKALGSVLNAPAELQKPMLQATLNEAQKRGFKWPSGLSKDPSNPETNAYLKQLHMQSGEALKSLQLQKTQAEINALNNKSEENKEGFTQETSLRKDYQTASQPYVASRTAYHTMQEVAKDDTGSNDLTLTFNFIKLQNPGARLQEGQIANAENSEV